MTVKIDGTNTVANPAFTGADTDTGLQCGTNELKLVTGGSARATIDSNGVVDVAHAYMQVGSGTDGFVQYKSSAGNWHAGAHANNALVFYSGSYGAGSERMRILSGGGLTFNGDTAAANALDDYEEGTFTPTVKGQTTAGTASYSHQHGKYTKIGDRVIVNGYVDWSSATGTGGLLIAGLPELSFNHAYRGIQTGSAMTSNLTFASGATSVVTYLPQNSNEIQVYISGSGQAWNHHPISASGSIIWQLTYVTAS